MALQRVCKTLLQNAFKGLLEDDQSFEIDGSIMDGRAVFKQILLRAEGLDRLIQGMPVQVASAKVDSVTLEVPWSTFWSTSSCAKVEIRGLQIELVPREQLPDPESQSAATAAAGSPGRRVLPQPEQQQQLEGQDAVDKELKKLLLETELSLMDTLVTLRSLPEENAAGHRDPVTLSMLLGALTVGNLGVDGDDSATATAAPEPELAAENSDGGQDFQKRISFEGLRIELSRPCGAGDECDATIIAQLRPHTPNTPDHLDVIYKKLPQLGGSMHRSGPVDRSGPVASPSKSLQLTGNFGELRSVLARTQVSEMLRLQDQINAAAVAMHQVDPSNSPLAHDATNDDCNFADAVPTQWDEAANGPSSTGASAVHGIAAGAASLMESVAGDELFLSANGDDSFGSCDPELAWATSSLVQSITDFDDEVASASTVCNVQLGCRHASLTLMLVKEDLHDLPAGNLRWLDAPPAVDPWSQEPCTIFDCESTTGQIHLAADNLELAMPGDGMEVDDGGADTEERDAKTISDQSHSEPTTQKYGEADLRDKSIGQLRRMCEEEPAIELRDIDEADKARDRKQAFSDVLLGVREWVPEITVGVQRLRCDEYLSSGCEYGRATVSASQQADVPSSSIGIGYSSHMSQSVLLPRPGSSSFVRNAILEMARPSRDRVICLRLLRPVHRPTFAPRVQKKPLRKGSLKLMPITLAIDTCFVDRLGTLLPPTDSTERSRTPVESPGVASVAETGHAEPPSLELSIECPRVTARLHFMMDNDSTPLCEYLELGPAVPDVGWTCMFRSWAAKSNSAGGTQLDIAICEQELRLCQNHGEAALLCKLGGEIRNGKHTEVTAEFCEEGPIGIEFESRGKGPLKIVGCKAGGAAANNPDVVPNSIVLAVNGTSVVGLPFQQAMGMVKAAPRPLVLTIQHPPGLRCDVATPAWRGKLKRQFCVPGLGRAANSQMTESRAQMTDRLYNAATSVSVAVSTVALGELRDVDYWRLKDLLTNLKGGTIPTDQPDRPGSNSGGSLHNRVSFLPCPEPEPEQQPEKPPPKFKSDDAPVIELLQKLAERIPGMASALSIEVQELTVAVRGQYEEAESESSEDDDDFFDPYAEAPVAAVDYGYLVRAKEFRVLNVACPCGGSALSSFSVSATRLFLYDTAARGTPLCLLETAKVPSTHGEKPGIGQVALLYERLVDEGGGTSSVLLQSSGLRFRPGWGSRPPDGSVISLDLVDCFRDHVASFFALSDTDDNSDDEREDVDEDHASPQRLLVRAEALSLVLAAPPVKSPSSSGLLLHIGSVDVDHGAGMPVATAATTAVVISDIALFLTDNHDRGKGNGPASEAELQRYVETYVEVAHVPVVNVSVQPGAQRIEKMIDVSCSRGDVPTSGAAAVAAAEAEVSPCISLRTCGDSFRTLNHLIQEILEARTTVLDIRKTPSGSGHSVSRAVFADGQTALIRQADETSAFEESSEAVQMETVQWASTPVIHDSYIDERGGGEDGNDAAMELARSAGSTDSLGFVDLAEELPPQSVALGKRPVGPVLASVSSCVDGETGLGLPDVPDSDHKEMMFEPDVLGNLMESYMQDRSIHGTSGGVAVPNEPAVPRLQTPPGIDDNSRQRPSSPLPQPVPARMFATYPEPSLQVSVCLPSAVWCIHDGTDWPEPDAGQSHDQKARARTGRRGDLHLKVHLTELRADYLTFPSPEEGEIEWRLQVTLRDLDAVDHVVRSRFQGQSALAVQQVVPNRQRETHAAVVALAVESVRAVRKDIGVDIESLLKLKLQVEPLRLCIDGGMWTRCDRFFRDTDPRPPVLPRPDDARFQLVEMDAINVMLDYVMDFSGTHLIHEKLIELMPVNVYVDPEKSGVRVNDVVDIVVGLFKEELKHRWPEEFATLMVSFKPIGALARVGGALADVPRTAIAEYRRSGDIKYAAYQLPTSTGQLIKTAVIEAADLAKYLASAAQTGLEYLDGRYVDTANKAAQTDPRLPAVPPPPTRSTAEARAAAGAADRSPAQAPFVAGLKQAGAAVKSGLAEATDAVVNAPLGQLETWQAGSAELPPVVTTVIRGVPVAILRPMIGATEAVSAISEGVRKSFAD